jgi:hypothetical protein
MTSNWITPQLKDTDQTFDPYFVGNKPNYTGFVGSDGVDARDRYAPIQFGQTAPATGMIANNTPGSFGNQDLNQLFAAIGTATYLQQMAFPSYFQTFDSGVTLTDRLTSRVGVIFRAAGGWEIWAYYTNYKTDTPGIYSPNPANNPAVNYSNGVLIAAGTWTQFNNVGNSPYIVYCNATGYDSGTANYYVYGQTQYVTYQSNYWANAGANDGVHNYTYSNNTQYSAIPDGRWYSLSSDVQYFMILDVQGGSGNRSVFDANGAISWYNMSYFNCTVARPGGQQTSSTVQLRNIIRWNPWNWSTGGGTGGGGGGSCVAATAWLSDTLQAGCAEAGTKILGMNDRLEFSDMTILSSGRRLADCIKITMEGGATLTLSDSTPLTLESGLVIMSKDATPGLYLPVKYRGEKQKWEQIKTIDQVGQKEVMLINVGGQSYAAGDEPTGLIYTHNNSQQK